MDAPRRRHRSGSERWGTMLPASWFTRVVIPVSFSGEADDGPMHIKGYDQLGRICYCHFVCDFSCPRRFASGRRAGGDEAFEATTRELRSWRTHAGRWLVCVVDRHCGTGRERTRYLTRETAPDSVCFECDDAE